MDNEMKELIDKLTERKIKCRRMSLEDEIDFCNKRIKTWIDARQKYIDYLKENKK